MDQIYTYQPQETKDTNGLAFSNSSKRSVKTTFIIDITNGVVGLTGHNKTQKIVFAPSLLNIPSLPDNYLTVDVAFYQCQECADSDNKRPRRS